MSNLNRQEIKEMEVIYICSPYRAVDEENLQRNIEYAKELTREALLRGESPVTVHLYMTQCLDESNEQERNTGLAAGRELIPRCDAVIVGARHGISAGMKVEIDFARRCGIPVRYIQE